MTPYWQSAGATLYHGDCLAVMRELPDGCVDAVVTSPPYAEQRAAFYGSIPEADYPAWTVEWMASCERLLSGTGSVLIVIREHIRSGQMSDYVHRTRLAVRGAGWSECDELIWLKPDGAPLGLNTRPRRSWERILWFSRSRYPWCDPTANGNGNRKTGHCSRPREWMHGDTWKSQDGPARCPDVATIPKGLTESTGHPAGYPVPLAAWLARLVTPPGGMVLDPFSGSGSTTLACRAEGFRCIGIEREEEYLKIAVARLSRQQPTLTEVAA